MKIEISARQGKIALLALRAEIARLSELNTPQERKENSIKELQELREYIAMTMLKRLYIASRLQYRQLLTLKPQDDEKLQRYI